MTFPRAALAKARVILWAGTAQEGLAKHGRDVIPIRVLKHGGLLSAFATECGFELGPVAFELVCSF